MAALHVSKRPRTFEGVVGNDMSVQVLRSILSMDKVRRPHALLLRGPSGCGKTTLARIFARELGCRSPIEINAANTRGIDSVRELVTRLHAPLNREVTVCILDECHELTKQAQEALLKPLEEPPENVYYVLCTTDPGAIIETVRNRLTEVPVQPSIAPELAILVDRVCTEEGIVLDPAIKQELLTAVDGVPRTALMVLDQIRDIPDHESQRLVIYEARSVASSMQNLCRALLSMDPNRWFTVRTELLNSADARKDPGRFRLELMAWLRVQMEVTQDLEQVDRYAHMIRVLATAPYQASGSTLWMCLFECCFI